MSIAESLETFSAARRESSTLHVLGVSLLFTSLLMIIPIIMAMCHGENVGRLLIAMIIGLAVSLFLTLMFKSPKTMRPMDGLLMIFVIWFGLFIFGMVPYLFYGLSFIDALFESVSGFTTVGATVISDVDSMEWGILTWRSMTQWIGGIIIVIMFMFIIPMVVSGGRGMLQNEMSGSGSGNLYVKMGKAAKQYIIVYVALTLIYFAVLFIILKVQGHENELLNAASIAMSVVCTGGFMVSNSSFADFDILTKIAVMIFMLLSATNFYLLYRAVVKREFGGFKRNEEFKAMIIWLGSLAILLCLVTFITNSNAPSDPAKSIVDVFFSVISLGTTTGLTTMNYIQEWSAIGVSILILIMFIGGSTGSTSGGIKITRALLIMKSLVNELRNYVHPNAVFGVKLDKKGVDNEIVHNATMVAMMFAITIFVAAIVFDNIQGVNMNFEDAFFTSVAIVSGTGPGAGDLFGNYCLLDPAAKLFTCFIMFLGRMEIITVIAVLTPGFWRETLGPRGLANLFAKRKKTVSADTLSDKDESNVVQKDEPISKKKVARIIRNDDTDDEKRL